MQIFLTVEVHGEQVKPLVGVMTHGPSAAMQGMSPVDPDMDTVRLGLEIANKVLGFAEGLRRVP